MEGEKQKKKKIGVSPCFSAMNPLIKRERKKAISFDVLIFISGNFFPPKIFFQRIVSIL